MKKILIFCAIIFSINYNSYAQTQKTGKFQYLSFQNSFILDSYNSLGLKVSFEYQSNFSEKWLYGISFASSRHLNSAATDTVDELSTNLNLLNFNIYHMVNLKKDKLFWIIGLGSGAVHAFWESNDRIGLVFNASATLNIRLGKRIFLQISPLIILPSERVYFSFMKISSHKIFYACDISPIGLKIKL